MDSDYKKIQLWSKFVELPTLSRIKAKYPAYKELNINSLIQTSHFEPIWTLVDLSNLNHPNEYREFENMIEMPRKILNTQELLVIGSAYVKESNHKIFLDEIYLELKTVGKGNTLVWTSTRKSNSKEVAEFELTSELKTIIDKVYSKFPTNTNESKNMVECTMR